MNQHDEELALLRKVLEVYDQKYVAEYLNNISPKDWCRETINRWLNGKASPKLSHHEFQQLERLLPPPPSANRKYEFDFIDLFAGIGGIRRGFDEIGGRCVLTSEWNKYSVQTYKANHYSDPDTHIFNEDIRELTLSDKEDVSESDAYKHIDRVVPDHDVLLAGFPCQPFSIAGVSKKNSLGMKHGFECKTQGTLFFDVARILAVKRPVAFVLENVKNLKSHDRGRTFKVITETLEELGYWISDAEHQGPSDPKIIDGKNFVPQHRERIVLVGFRKDLSIHTDFSLSDVTKHIPKRKTVLGDLLESKVDDKYILTPKLWEYLFNYSIKHKEKGNGFGYGLVKGTDTTRTLSARYHKDGSEILVDRGFNPELPLSDASNQANRPRRLTPRECARLMGYDAPGDSNFRIPVSDTQAYRQFGNSVVVPVFSAVAKLMKSRILEGKKKAARPLKKVA
ncbi:DNA (cytosine-5)-methyltransferase 1 [Herbaspirillum sp. Sphag1AN]|uniref:DNA (cytosine-5-)-methyltransferase n=1 Tax=unclassified Herbaspirillum TaxID=2624150 RepID=UPI001615C0A7|nr:MULTISPECIES: DNA (cytosine-5-)-methyltransferase [unclassified Herbaspirillum]MBB3214090.1 DNA (cytosine-5)-methyltransferase 1 [Herbaspirillum sp. Sphag1AN]MBB3247823.1 DNA (cytosine-5)-methyltransferase 1 [Herbaspirillum sp. Sphag64]